MPDYGEPWEMDGTDIADNAGKMVCESFLSEKDQLRAISCVNACVGIEDPERVIPLLVALVEAAKTYERRKALILFTGGNLEAVHDAYLSALGNAIAAKGDRR